jgi:hypothetical protein
MTNRDKTHGRGDYNENEIVWFDLHHATSQQTFIDFWSWDIKVIKDFYNLADLYG